MSASRILAWLISRQVLRESKLLMDIWMVLHVSITVFWAALYWATVALPSSIDRIVGGMFQPPVQLTPYVASFGPG